MSWLNIWRFLVITLGLSFALVIIAEEATESESLKPTEEILESAEEAMSLYKRLGGLMPISAVVDDFIDALMLDDVLNANPEIDAARKRVPAAYLKHHMIAMVCQATGGPCQYHGRDMKVTHVHLNISEVEWAQMLVLFNEVLTKYEVPEAEMNELLAIIDSTKADIVMRPTIVNDPVKK